MLRLESSTSTADAPHAETHSARPVVLRRRERTAELLARYARTGSSECFEEIVHRYGAMVLAVCEGVTRNRHDAEDATQATFFVLAERLRAGETIRSLGSWLQQVARRASVDLRRSRDRRHRRERDRAAPEAAPDCPAEQCNDEQVARLVREELDRIPAKYRIPIVLHYFGGLDFAEAARELGLKPATLGVRLFRGRKLLGERLARRGVMLSAPALATCLARIVKSSLSHALHQSAARAAMSGASVGTPVATAPILGGGLLSGLVSSKVKLLVAAALVVAAAAGARAAVHHLPDLPHLLDLGRLRPSLPTLKSNIRALRADAGANPPATDHPNSTDHQDSPRPPVSVAAEGPRLTAAQSDPSHGTSASSGRASVGGGVIAYTSAANSARPIAAPLPPPTAVSEGGRALAGAGTAPVSAPSGRTARRLPGGTSPIAASTGQGAGLPQLPASPLTPPGLPGANGSLETLASNNGHGLASTPIVTAAPTFPAGPTQSTGPTSLITDNAPTPPPAPTLPPTSVATAGGGNIADGGNVTSGTGSLPPQAGAGLLAGAAGTNANGATGGSSPQVSTSSPYAGLLTLTSTGSSAQLSYLDPTDASVPALPGGQNFLGVWSVSAGQLPANSSITLNYDAPLLSTLGTTPSQVTLWAYNGKWAQVPGSDTPDGATISNNVNSIQFFAMGTPEPTSGAIAAVAGLLLLMRRRRRRT